MVDFNDRRRGPVTDALGGLYGNGKRYRVTTQYPEPGGREPAVGQMEGYLAPVPDNEDLLGITKSSKSKASDTIHHAHITKIEEARAARNGDRATIYSRPDHRQDGYGRT